MTHQEPVEARDRTAEGADAPDPGRRAALRELGALAGAAPAVALLLSPSASRAWGNGGSPCEGDRHRNCHGQGHGDDRPGNGHGWGHEPGHGGNGWGKGWGKGWDNGWGHGGKPPGKPTGKPGKPGRWSDKPRGRDL